MDRFQSPTPRTPATLSRAPASPRVAFPVQIPPWKIAFNILVCQRPENKQVPSIFYPRALHVVATIPTRSRHSPLTTDTAAYYIARHTEFAEQEATN